MPKPKAKPRVENNRVLVTGGAGFVGSHLCTYLVNRGDHVRPSAHQRTPEPVAHCAVQRRLAGSCMFCTLRGCDLWPLPDTERPQPMHAAGACARGKVMLEAKALSPVHYMHCAVRKLHGLTRAPGGRKQRLWVHLEHRRTQDHE